MRDLLFSSMIIIEEVDGPIEQEPEEVIVDDETDGGNTDGDTTDGTDPADGDGEEEEEPIIVKPPKKKLSMKEMRDKLNTIKAKQVELFVTAKIDLGAPVLDATNQDSSGTKEEPVVSDGIVAAKGYTPVVITKTETNKEWKQGDEVPTPVFVVEIEERETFFEGVPDKALGAIAIIAIVVAGLCCFAISGKLGHKEIVKRRDSIRRASSVAAS